MRPLAGRRQVRSTRVGKAAVGAALALVLTCGQLLERPAMAEPETITPADIAALVDENAGKVVVVNFWATWCPPCLREFPDIIAFYDNNRDAALAVLAVSMNEADEVDEIEAFLETFEPPFPVYRAASPDTEFYEGVLDSWFGEMPMTLIYDPSGALARVHKKPLTYDELADDVAALLSR